MDVELFLFSYNLRSITFNFHHLLLFSYLVERIQKSMSVLYKYVYNRKEEDTDRVCLCTCNLKVNKIVNFLTRLIISLSFSSTSSQFFFGNGTSNRLRSGTITVLFSLSLSFYLISLFWNKP